MPSAFAWGQQKIKEGFYVSAMDTDASRGFYGLRARAQSGVIPAGLAAAHQISLFAA